MIAQTADLDWLLRQKSPKDMGGRINGALRTTKWPVPEIVILAQYGPDKGITTLARENGMSKGTLKSGLEFMGLIRTKEQYHRRQKERAKPRAELQAALDYKRRAMATIRDLGRTLKRLEDRVANIPRLAQRHANRGQLSLVKYYRTCLWKHLHQQPSYHRKDIPSRYGCTIDALRAHIESQWLPGMSWDNHTWDGWHIDHIKPCSSFRLTDPEQVRLCYHYTNLRPLWAMDNWRKSDKVEHVTT